MGKANKMVSTLDAADALAKAALGPTATVTLERAGAWWKLALRTVTRGTLSHGMRRPEAEAKALEIVQATLRTRMWEHRRAAMDARPYVERLEREAAECRATLTAHEAAEARIEAALSALRDE